MLAHPLDARLSELRATLPANVRLVIVNGLWDPVPRKEAHEIALPEYEAFFYHYEAVCKTLPLRGSSVVKPCKW